MKVCLTSALVGLSTFLANSACGSSVIQVSMPMMIVRAEAIGLARIDAAEIIPPEPTNESEFRSFNGIFTLTVIETWRGKLPRSFKAKAYSDKYRNPSARVGQQVLVFIGNSIPHVGAKLPEDFRPVFEAGQRFKVVADLVKSGDMEIVETMPPDESARIAELLTSNHTFSRPAYVTLVVNKDGQGMATLIGNGDQKTLKLVNADLQSKDFSKLESLPFQGQLCLYLEEGKLKFLVREK